jgi:peptidylprolyl isomerase
MNVGESKTVNILAAQAYGLHRSDLVFSMDLDQLPDNVAVGQQYEVTQNDGSIIIIKILEIFETTAMIDANHPLAGEDLIFEIELIEIE